MLPGEPGLAYRPALCADAGSWDALFEDGSCELTFLCLDPVAWGEERIVQGEGAGTSFFDLGGTWRTWPRVEATAAEGEFVEFRDLVGGREVRVEREFSGGEEVVVDCASDRAWVDGAPADADVVLESDFFWLEPGECSVGFFGVEGFQMTFDERWL